MTISSLQISLCGPHVHVHVYQLQPEGPSHEELDDEQGDLAAASHWMLPAVQFHGLWDSLVFDSSIKSGVRQTYVIHNKLSFMIACNIRRTILRNRT